MGSTGRSSSDYTNMAVLQYGFLSEPPRLSRRSDGEGGGLVGCLGCPEVDRVLLALESEGNVVDCGRGEIYCVAEFLM